MAAIHATGGKLTKGQLLRLKANHFTRGGIFGTAGFVKAVFESVRERFRKYRKSGARKLKAAEMGKVAGVAESEAKGRLSFISRWSAVPPLRLKI